MKGFEIIDDQSALVERPTVEVSKPSDNQQDSGKTKLEVAAESFDSIMKLASEITEIKKLKVQGELALQKMEKDKEMLLAEAQSYAARKNADTRNVVDRMNVVRGMMQDFYAQSNQQITGEDFRIIITEIVNQMGRVENGQK